MYHKQPFRYHYSYHSKYGTDCDDAVGQITQATLINPTNPRSTQVTLRTQVTLITEPNLNNSSKPSYSSNSTTLISLASRID